MNGMIQGSQRGGFAIGRYATSFKAGAIRPVYTPSQRGYHAAFNRTRETHPMRAEIEQLSDAAKQSIGLLRRHL